MTSARYRSILAFLLVGLTAMIVAPGAAWAAVPRLRVVQPVATTAPVPPHVLYLPSNAAARQPLPVLVALHGMGGDGAGFSAPLVAYAERHGWALVAPTFGYGDWRDPEQVRLDDTYFLPQLKTLLDSLPSRTGLQMQPRALMYGFSRGGQEAHRFAEFYPQSVLGVASFSCGTFTLPYTSAPPSSPGLSMAFPFGMADLERYTGRPLNLDALRRVKFMVGVGAADAQSSDLPRQWDTYLGTTRVERAQSYYQALTSLSIPAQLVVFPDTVHAESEEMRARAMEFLAGTNG